MKKIFKLCAVIVALVLFTGFGVYAASGPSRRDFNATSSVSFFQDMQSYIDIAGKVFVTPTQAVWDTASPKSSMTTKNYKFDEQGKISDEGTLQNWEGINLDLDKDNKVVTFLFKMFNPSSRFELYITPALPAQIDNIQSYAGYKILSPDEQPQPSYTDLEGTIELAPQETLEVVYTLTLVNTIANALGTNVNLTFNISVLAPRTDE